MAVTGVEEAAEEDEDEVATKTAEAVVVVGTRIEEEEVDTTIGVAEGIEEDLMETVAITEIEAAAGVTIEVVVTVTETWTTEEATVDLTVAAEGTMIVAVVEGAITMIVVEVAAAILMIVVVEEAKAEAIRILAVDHGEIRIVNLQLKSSANPIQKKLLPALDCSYCRERLELLRQL